MYTINHLTLLTILIHLIILSNKFCHINADDSTQEINSADLQNSTQEINLADLQNKFTISEKNLISAAFYNFTMFDQSLLAEYTISGLNSLKNTNVQTLITLYIKYAGLLSSYKFDPPNFSEQMIKFYINFCKTIYDLDGCISNFNETTSISAFNVTGGKDILFGINVQKYTISCNVVYALAQDCGTFIEIHRPFDERIIEQNSVNYTEPGQYYFDYLTTKNLCAGKYEVIHILY